MPRGTAVADAGAPVPVDVEAPAGPVAAPAALGVAVDPPASPADHAHPANEEDHDVQEHDDHAHPANEEDHADHAHPANEEDHAETSKKCEGEDKGSDHLAPVGIDLGAAFCSVAVFLNGRAEVLPCEPDGSLRSPSTVAFTEFERLFGKAAEAQAAKNPLNTVTDGVRLLGKRFSDPEVQAWKKLLWPGGQLVRGWSGEPRLRVVAGGREFVLSGEVICAMLIERLLKIAERHVAKVLDKNDVSVKHVCVSMPGGVNHSVVAALRRVGAILGIQVWPVRDIKALGIHHMIASVRPSAEAVLEGQRWRERPAHVSLHIDVGAQGFRVGYIIADDLGSMDALGEVGTFRAGAGCALHATLIEHFIAEIHKELGDSGSGSSSDAATGGLVDRLEDDPRALRRLRQHAVAVLGQMSSTGAADVAVEIPSILSARPDYCFARTLSKTFFQQFFAPHIKAVTTLVRKVLKTGARARVGPVVEVVLTGAGVRLPGLRQAIQKVAQNQVDDAGAPGAGGGVGQRSPISFLHYSSGDVLAQGCAHLAALLLGRRELFDMLMLGVAGVAINVRLPNSKKLIPLVSSSHTVPYKIHSLARRENETAGLAPELIFPVNSWEERTRAVVEVYQGPDSCLSNNRLLERLVLDDLPPVKPGGARVLHVSVEAGCDEYSKGDVDEDVPLDIVVFCSESGRRAEVTWGCGRTGSYVRAEHVILWRGLLPKLARRDERIRAARDYVSSVEDMMFCHLPEEVSDLILSEYVGSVGEGAAGAGGRSDGVSEDQLEALRLRMQNLRADEEEEDSDVASELEGNGVNGADVEPLPGPGGNHEGGDERLPGPGGNHEGGDEQEVHDEHVGGETDIGE